MTDTTSPRGLLIQTAFDLLERQGYNGTGLNQIIEESKTPKGSLYHYFPGGKEELFVAAVEVKKQKMAQLVQTALASSQDPATAFQNFFKRIGKALEECGYRSGGAVASITLETSGSSEQLQKACETAYEELRQLFEDKLREAGLAPNRAYALSLVIGSAVEGATVICRAQRNSIAITETGKAVAQLIRAELSA
jgi:TetR/AcrR family transcriptional repressor of lmrAB and yxaGH operons